MNKRPVTVTIIGCLLLVVGVAGTAFHLHEVGPQHALQGENVWIFVVEFAAIVSGVFLLRGNNWARWLALIWMAFHVVFSFFNSWREVGVHGLFFLLFACFLFHRGANSYFRRRDTAGG